MLLQSAISKWVLVSELTVMESHGFKQSCTGLVRSVIIILSFSINTNIYGGWILNQKPRLTKYDSVKISVQMS